METKIIRMIMVLLCINIGLMNAQKVMEYSGFSHPESVVTYKEYLFVSNMGTKTDLTVKDGQGYISMLSRANGKVLEEKFITGLNAPKGMFVKGGTLYMSDIDRVLGYDIDTKEKVWEVDLSGEGVTYANDIAKACGGLFVSSTQNDAIYKVKKSGKIKQLNVKGQTHGANGIHKGCGKLFVANYGRGGEPDGSFGKIGLCSKKYKEYQSGGAYDGIGKLKGNLLVTDWVSSTSSNGRLITYKRGSKEMRVIDLGRTIDGPSDMCIDKKNKVIWIPAQRENKLLSIAFSELQPVP